MPCETRGNTIICTRGPARQTSRRCQSCGVRPAELQCDFPDLTHASGTCDRFLCMSPECVAHRWTAGERMPERADFCRSHVIERAEIPAEGITK